MKRPGLWVCYLFIMVPAMAFSYLGATLPDIREQFDLTRTHAGILPMVLCSGAVAGMLVVGFLVHIASPRRWMVATMGTEVVGALLMANATRLVTFIVGLAILAFGHGIAVAFAGSFVQRLTVGRSSRSMNVLYGFFAAGVTIEPVLAGQMLHHGASFRAPAWVLAGAALVVMVLSALAVLPQVGAPARVTTASLRRLFGKHRAVFLGLAAVQFVYVGAEAVANVWIPEFLLSAFPTNVHLATAGLVLTGFWAAMTVGRWISGALSRWVSPFRILLVLNAVSVVGIVTAVSTKSPTLAKIMFVVLGLGFSGVVPLILAAVEHLPAETSTTAFAIVLASGMLGAAVISPVVGPIADVWGFRVGMLTSVIPIGLLIAGIVLLRVRRGLFS